MKSALSASFALLFLTACGDGQNRHQAFADCQLQALQFYAHEKDPMQQYNHMGDFTLLCMEKKNYDVAFDGPKCTHQLGQASMSTNDEQCYSRHGGD